MFGRRVCWFFVLNVLLANFNLADASCSVNVALTLDRKLVVTNQDELCSCLRFDKSIGVRNTTKISTCNVKSFTLGGGLALSVDDICGCAGYTPTKLPEKDMIKHKVDDSVHTDGKTTIEKTFGTDKHKDRHITDIIEPLSNSTVDETSKSSSVSMSNSTEILNSTKILVDNTTFIHTPEIVKHRDIIRKNTTELSIIKEVTDKSSKSSRLIVPTKSGTSPVPVSNTTEMRPDKHNSTLTILKDKSTVISEHERYGKKNTTEPTIKLRPVDDKNTTMSVKSTILGTTSNTTEIVPDERNSTVLILKSNSTAGHATTKVTKESDEKGKNTTEPIIEIKSIHVETLNASRVNGTDEHVTSISNTTKSKIDEHGSIKIILTSNSSSEHKSIKTTTIRPKNDDDVLFKTTNLIPIADRTTDSSKILDIDKIEMLPTPDDRRDEEKILPTTKIPVTRHDFMESKTDDDDIVFMESTTVAPIINDTDIKLHSHDSYGSERRLEKENKVNYLFWIIITLVTILLIALVIFLFIRYCTEKGSYYVLPMAKGEKNTELDTISLAQRK